MARGVNGFVATRGRKERYPSISMRYPPKAPVGGPVRDMLPGLEELHPWDASCSVAKDILGQPSKRQGVARAHEYAYWLNPHRRATKGGTPQWEALDAAWEASLKLIDDGDGEA